MMTDTELEIAILRKYVDRFKKGWVEDRNNKCLRELKMHDVIHELTGLEGADLDFAAQHWHGKLVSERAGERNEKPLRRCSDSNRTGEHRWHARAYEDGTGFIPAQARIDALEERLRQQQGTVNINTMNVKGIANVGGIIQNQRPRKRRKKT